MASILLMKGGDQPAPLEGETRPDIESILRSSGYSVAARTLDDRERAGHELGGSAPPDAILADVRLSADLLPLRHLRRRITEAWGEDLLPPVLGVLAPKHLSQPDWLALVNDFVLPPIEPTELVSRIRLLLFRQRFVNDLDSLRYAGTRLQTLQKHAFDDASGSRLPLTPREYELLQFLLTHRGRYFARERLLDMVWGVDFTGGERTVDIHIRRLRAKLPEQTALLLETRRTVGYGFATDHDRRR